MFLLWTTGTSRGVGAPPAPRVQRPRMYPASLHTHSQHRLSYRNPPAPTIPIPAAPVKRMTACGETCLRRITVCPTVSAHFVAASWVLSSWFHILDCCVPFLPHLLSCPAGCVSSTAWVANVRSSMETLSKKCNFYVHTGNTRHEQRMVWTS